MSIIADALRKAERERKQRELVQNNESRDRTPPEVFSNAIPIENSIQDSTTTRETYEHSVGFRLNGFASWVASETALLATITVLLASVLFVLPKWPAVRDESNIDWHFSLIRWRVFPSSLPAAGVKWVRKIAQEQNVLLPFTLSGISSSSDGRYAIVNRTVVRENDLVDGALVKTISGQEVKLKTNNGEITLRLKH